MPIIVLRTRVAAPPARCFDFARDIDLHQRSTAASHERAVAGVMSGLLGAGDESTWEATLVRGAFRRFRHEHQFLPVDGGTEVVDIFDYSAPLGPLGWLADHLFLRRYMTALLRERNAYLKHAGESAPSG